jgi:cob(I)alamin adenosyltransferase
VGDFMKIRGVADLDVQVTEVRNSSWSQASKTMDAITVKSTYVNSIHPTWERAILTSRSVKHFYTPATETKTILAENHRATPRRYERCRVLLSNVEKAQELLTVDLNLNRTGGHKRASWGDMMYHVEGEG